MRFLSIFALLGLLSSCSASFPSASEEAAQAARDLPSIRVGEHVFERRLLGNGLRAVAAQNADEGVSVFVTMAAGERYETPSTTGLDHLTENAVYTGTAKTGPGEHERLIEQMGGNVADPPAEEDEVLHDERIQEFEPGRLGNGVFIVATGNLATSMFAEAVILITRYESGGTVGLTVNRPSEIPLSKAFSHIDRLKDEQAPLFLGGPVSPSAVFALVRSDRPQAGMERIAEGIYFSPGLDPVLEDPSRDLSADSIRVFAGYAGWAPGQLEAEIERGDWIVAWENPAVAFARDVKKLWRKLLQSWSGRWT